VKIRIITSLKKSGLAVVQNHPPYKMYLDQYQQDIGRDWNMGDWNMGTRIRGTGIWVLGYGGLEYGY